MRCEIPLENPDGPRGPDRDKHNLVRDTISGEIRIVRIARSPEMRTRLKEPPREPILRVFLDRKRRYPNNRERATRTVDGSL